MQATIGNLQSWYETVPPETRGWLGLLLLLILSAIAFLIARRVALPLIDRLARRTTTFWDETLYQNRVFHRLSWAAPLTVLYLGLEVATLLPDEVRSALQRIAAGLLVIAITRALSAVLGAAGQIYNRYPASRGRPIKGYLQGISLVLYILGAVVAIGLFIDRSPWLLLSGIGAMTAVLTLVFRDTLLSLVAGIQLTTNDLIRVGDWIEMPQFDADGDVVDVALNNVRVQNWDKTFTVIPGHKFLEHSFRNWRGMQESGGRRIKRSLLIDMGSIRFLTADEVEQLRRFVLLRDYLDAKVAELEEYNREHLGATGFVANARRLTNVGTFRAYVANYLRNHPMIDQEMTFLVRQLQPTSQGLPLEIYVFVNDTRWAVYEGVQADVFDHLLAIIPEFGLRLFQEPTGNDLSALAHLAARETDGAPDAVPARALPPAPREARSDS